MTDTKTMNEFRRPRLIARKTARTVRFQINNLAMALTMLMPFIVIEDQSTPEFWQSVGCYGVFLIGVSAFAVTLYPRLQHK